jgi:hypothetical protein
MMHRAIAEKLAKVLEAVLKDLKDNIEQQARYERCSDAATALYGVAHAIDMVYVPDLVLDALEIPRDPADDNLDPLKIPER